MNRCVTCRDHIETVTAGRLEKSLASLRTWLALVAALALAALGLAIYSTLADNNSGAQSWSRHGRWRFRDGLRRSQNWRALKLR